MKKVVFFMHNFTGGGAEKVTIKLANELYNRGYKVDFIVKDDFGVLKDTVNKNIYINNLNIQSKSKSKLLQNLINIKELVKINNYGSYDVMISVTSHMNLISAIANSISKRKVKLYTTIHSMTSRENKKFQIIRNTLIRLFDKFVETNIVVSKEAEQDFINTIGIAPNKSITIYNPVVSEEIFELKEESVNHKWLNKNRSFKTILAVGRLTEAKNYEMLLKSIAIVRNEINVRLIILGDGELKEELRNLCKQLKIDDIVDFNGFVSNPYAYFSKCDLFTLSSNWEGLPTVLIEAMACGCNIVSTECPSGPKEILKNGLYGKLTPVNDYKSFADAIYDALNSKYDREAQINRAKDFSIQNSVRQYLELIDR